MLTICSEFHHVELLDPYLGKVKIAIIIIIEVSSWDQPAVGQENSEDWFFEIGEEGNSLNEFVFLITVGFWNGSWLSVDLPFGSAIIPKANPT